MTKYIIKEGQTLLDIAVQKYGSVEGIQYLLEDNASITEVTDELKSGDTLIIRDDSYIIDKTVVNYFKEKNISLATGE
jgi:hypothetical protein